MLSIGFRLCVDVSTDATASTAASAIAAAASAAAGVGVADDADKFWSTLSQQHNIPD